MTTNCIVPPKDSYKDRIYTTGATGYPGCTHITPGPDGKKISHKSSATPNAVQLQPKSSMVKLSVVLPMIR